MWAPVRPGWIPPSREGLSDRRRGLQGCGPRGVWQQGARVAPARKGISRRGAGAGALMRVCFLSVCLGPFLPCSGGKGSPFRPARCSGREPWQPSQTWFLFFQRVITGASRRYAEPVVFPTPNLVAFPPTQPTNTALIHQDCPSSPLDWPALFPPTSPTFHLPFPSHIH